jgi:N-(2-amino-2-carboxyethyl)-L-glutamate synthase
VYIGPEVLAAAQCCAGQYRGGSFVIHDSPDSLVTDDIFVELPGFLPGVEVVVKLEGLNPAGSIKLKTARALIAAMEECGALKKGGRVIESSSGNLGIALAGLCAARGYHLTIVTDPRASVTSVAAMQALGAEVVVVTEPDCNGGYLQSRIALIMGKLAEDPALVWTNQYANRHGAATHYETTARSIHAHVPHAHAVVIGTGTTGTLMGCARYFAQHSPRTRVVAVDSLGSVLFGDSGSARYVPGMGVSRVPELYSEEFPFEKLVVPERDGVVTCRQVARKYGLLLGGSTGSILAGVARIRPDLPTGATVVALSPDMGYKYLDTIYSDTWFCDVFGRAGSSI